MIVIHGRQDSSGTRDAMNLFIAMLLMTIILRLRLGFRSVHISRVCVHSFNLQFNAIQFHSEVQRFISWALASAGSVLKCGDLKK